MEAPLLQQAPLLRRELVRPGGWAPALPHLAAAGGWAEPVCSRGGYTDEYQFCCLWRDSAGGAAERVNGPPVCPLQRTPSPRLPAAKTELERLGGHGTRHSGPWCSPDGCCSLWPKGETQIPSFCVWCWARITFFALRAIRGGATSGTRQRGRHLSSCLPCPKQEHRHPASAA